MTHDSSAPNVLIDPTFKVEFKINAKHDLSDEEGIYERGEAGLNVARTSPCLLCMAKEESNN